MASERSDPTLADYVAMAISPALIMGLVGSLVFFLLEVFYSGQYEGRLQWILFFFVFGAVLIARVSMMGDIAGRANLYGLTLGFLVWLGMQFYVEYPADSPAAHLSFLINLALVGLVWWCAHRLTWDCTHLPEDNDPGGEGLLQEAAGTGHEDRGSTAEGEEGAKRPGWLERYRRYREGKKKRRALGVWVVYFSLAALPLFGLGQSLIPAGEVARRRYAFWLMSLYVACGLGLLLTTCFLSLRRYLRQKKLRMPVAMTGTWLTTGTVLIGLLLAAGALLPRPQAEYPLFEFGSAGSKNRTASNMAFKGDTPGKGEGRPGAEPPPGHKDPAQSGGGKGEKGKGGQGKDGQGKGQDGSGRGKDGSGQGKGESGKDDSGRDKSGQNQNNPERGNGQRNQGANDRGEVKDSRQGKESSSARGGSDRRTNEDRAGQSGGPTASSPRVPSFHLPATFQSLARVLRWVVFGALALVVLFAVLRGGLQFLANFTDWARNLLDALRNLWAGLFGRRDKGREGEEGDAGAEGAAPPEPFASFRNPFAGGGRMAVPELIRYTFTALQAWARERDLGRQPGETPLEFAERVGREVPALEADVRRLALLYARAVYARGGLPANSTEVVRAFWERLEAVAEQPLSA